MQKEDLSVLIDAGLSGYKIATRLGVARTTIEYWLKKHDLKTAFHRKDHAVCRHCKTTGGREAFYQQSNGSFTFLCKKCWAKYLKDKSRCRKLELIIWAGGKCHRCGVEANEQNVVIFDFHHTNPANKLRNVKSSSLSLSKMKEEAKKCIVLCSNCHRLEHQDILAGVSPRSYTSLKG